MKNKVPMTVLFLVLCGIAFSQKKSTPRAVAADEIQVKVKPIIYLLGGIVSSVGEKEVDFAKKYNIAFHDFGCLAPTNLEDYEALNFKTFDLLNLQFGIKWQEEIKPTALGFAKWKGKNK